MDYVYGLLVSWVPGFAALPPWLALSIATLVPAVAALTFMSAGPLLYVYAERKISAFMQDRLGPMRVGKWGLLQTVADTIKLLFKEAIFPKGVDRLLFSVGPGLVLVGALLAFVVLPFGRRIQAADLNIGLFYVVAVSSLSTVGIIMSGWASNNKYALFGAMRSAAQIVSYEIPSVLSLLPVVLIVQSLSLQDIVAAQQGGLHHWFVFRYFPLMPVAFLVFFTAGMAECNRAPFDIPEAESELVAGFHTEYSGFFFALFFMAEYAEMFVISAVGSVVFLGGFLAPLPALQQIGGLSLGWFWLIAKAWFLVAVMMWLRWTLPRLRVDQLMYVAWKVLLPVSLVLTVVIGALVLWPATANGFPSDPAFAWLLTLALAAWLTLIAVRGRQWAVARQRDLR